MSVRPDFDNIIHRLAAKAAGHFTIERWGVGWAINVHRTGKRVETILAASPGEVNQLRMRLSDEGLCGFIGKGA